MSADSPPDPACDAPATGSAADSSAEPAASPGVDRAAASTAPLDGPGAAPLAARPPRRRRKAERTPEIVAAATASFTEHGYAETRLEDVAERAGIAKSTIYLYFANKEALFRASVEARFRESIGELDELIDRFEGPTAELLATIVTGSYENLVRSDIPALLRTIIAEGERFPELRQVFHDEKLRHSLLALERVIARGISRGEFREGPASAFPRMLVAPTLMVSIWLVTFEEIDPIDIEAWAKAHVDLLLNGLSA